MGGVVPRYQDMIINYDIRCGVDQEIFSSLAAEKGDEEIYRGDYLALEKGN